MKIITVGNTKGGVGKSTIATNLAVEAARDKKKVLLIDADIQASSMGFRGLRETDDIKATAILTPTLHKDLTSFNFDLIIIDAGGRDTGVFRSAILAADFLLLPTKPSQFDVWSTKDTIDILEEVRLYKENLPARMVLNQAIPNTVIGREAKEALKGFKEFCPLTEVTLHNRVAFEQSAGQGLGVSEHEPNGKAAEEIRELYNEIMAIIGG